MNHSTESREDQFQPSQQGAIPAGLIEFAYIDRYACAAAGAMSISQWHTLVNEKKAPQPVIRQPRFTRWLLSDVRDWLIQYRTQSGLSKDSECVLGKAKKASQAAKVKSIELRQLQS